MVGILFLCVHNAGRSQMAAGFARALGGSEVNVLSGGSEPANTLNPVAVAAMGEVGIDISSAFPKIFTIDMLESVDVVVTMGCGDSCPIIPNTKYVDWPLTDPAGQPLEVVRRIRDDIKARVEELLAELHV